MAVNAKYFLGSFLVTISLLAGAGCATSDHSVIEQAANTQKSLEPAVIEDPQINEYFRAIGDRIIAAAKAADEDHVGPKTHFDKKQQEAWMFSDKETFHLVNSKTLNAFTTGGEHLYIYNELFQQCKSEDELAAVMSHEYAHVYCRHVAQGMSHQMETLIAGAALGAGAGYALGGSSTSDKLAAAGSGAGVGAAGGQFLNMGFTRKDEAQADEFGFYFYTHAGWHPEHFADFFQHMIDAGYDKTPGYMSDHPTLKSRVDEANARVKKLPPDAKDWLKAPIADASKFKQYQAHAAQLAKTLPDDSSLKNSQQLLQALPRSCVAPVDPKDAVDARKNLADKANNADASGTTTKKRKTDGE